ncbi:MAG TPA: hypothetical protein V6C85_21230 [Allocoleopsis sp.]
MLASNDDYAKEGYLVIVPDLYWRLEPGVQHLNRLFTIHQQENVMVAQVNSQAAKTLEVADDPRLSRQVKEFLKVLNSGGVGLETLPPLEARQVLVDAQASILPWISQRQSIFPITAVIHLCLICANDESQLNRTYALPLRLARKRGSHGGIASTCGVRA